MSTWTQGLNPEQIEAVSHDYGPQLILAGAGSGKTTVLVSRTGRLIDEKICKPEHILALTFTNKSARELKHRVSDKIGKKGNKIVAGTFHSFGLSILKKHYKEAELPQKFGIIDNSDAKSILKNLLKETKVIGKDSFDLDQMLFIISKWRASGQSKVKETAMDDPYQEVVQMLLPKYIKQLSLMGVVDFDGLLLKPIEILKSNQEVLKKYQNQFKQIMVDEFQDTNDTQMKLIQFFIE